MDLNALKNNINIIREFFLFDEHIYIVPYLHSKIYCNESEVFIASLNLTISSLFNQNEESGVLLGVNYSEDLNEFYRVNSHVK